MPLSFGGHEGRDAMPKEPKITKAELRQQLAAALSQYRRR